MDILIRTMPLSEIVPLRSLVLAFSTLLVVSSVFVATIKADCECGYSSKIGNDGTYLFTDLIESDFLHLANISSDTDWRRQSFSVTAATGRGPYGMNFSIDNVASNPILDPNTWDGPGEFSPDPGVQLLVRGGVPVNGYVQVAEVDSAREDLLWGTYRAAMKLTLVPGTCSAFFWVSSWSSSVEKKWRAEINADYV